MKILLLKDVPKVGRKNDIIEAKDGYAQNYLIPNGFGIFATPKIIEKVKKEKKNIELHKEAEIEEIRAKISELNKKGVSIESKTNEKGHLFAGVGKNEIATKSGLPEEIIVLDHPIKEVGEHEVEIKAGEKKIKLKITIVGVK